MVACNFASHFAQGRCGLYSPFGMASLGRYACMVCYLEYIAASHAARAGSHTNDAAPRAPPTSPPSILLPFDQPASTLPTNSTSIMAANYWASSQRLHWQLSREKLAEIRHNLDAQDEETVRAYPLPSQRHLSIFFNTCMTSNELDIARDTVRDGDANCTSIYRSHSPRSAYASQTASPRYRAAIRAKILHQGPHP
jgi:hypothetical protein